MRKNQRVQSRRHMAKKKSHLGDEFGTPQDLFDILNKEFKFVLDAAASDKNHKCRRYYTKEKNALVQPWYHGRHKGNVFCNPPYSRKKGNNPGILGWCQKALREVMLARYDYAYDFKVVLLIPGDFSTQYFRFCNQQANIRLIGRRFAFEGGESSARFPGMIVVFSADKDETERGKIELWSGYNLASTTKK